MAEAPISTEKMDYKAAGLDLNLYEDGLSRISKWVKRTHGPRVLDGFGGFASLFSLDFTNKLFARNYKNPVLVSGSDGVGTKLKVASMLGRHDTVGIDLVAMSVNDILCTGAEPLFFLDYVAQFPKGHFSGQGIAVAVKAGTGKAKDNIPFTNAAAIKDVIPIDHPNAEPGEVIVFGLVDIRQNGGFPTNKGATRFHTTNADAFDDLF